MDDPNLGLTIDAFNIYLADKCSYIEYLRTIDLEKILSTTLTTVKICPWEFYHCHRLMPGDGVVPLNKFSEILKEKGYTDGASIELFRPEYWKMDPELVIKMGAEKTKLFYNLCKS